jgi:16S rRNA (cytidine1402-2'-O)-methyltransferase
MNYGTLIIAAAPIGNLDDASPRLRLALERADVIAAEDTRRLRRLATGLDLTLSANVVSYYDAVEQKRVPGLLDDLRSGKDILVITDAGMPAISDPGYRLVDAASREGIQVTVLPGPSAVIAALALSGLPTDRFCFEGFPPRREHARARYFAELASEPRTIVFFESPRRLASTLMALAEAMGPQRRAVVCRELTKIHEEVRRGTIQELAEWSKRTVLGEITIVVEGSRKDSARNSSLEESTSPTAGDAAAEVLTREAAGSTRKSAITSVARDFGLPRRVVYNAVQNALHHLPDDSETTR